MFFLSRFIVVKGQLEGANQLEGTSQLEGFPCHEWRSVLLRSVHLWLLSTRWELGNLVVP